MSHPALRSLLSCAAALLLLAGCASTAPTHYHSLLEPAGTRDALAGSEAGADAALPMPILVLPVAIPTEVDAPQLLVRSSAGGVQPLEHERWVAPLADELRAALSEDLSRRLGVPDVSGQPSATGSASLRIKVDVRRFESAPGQYAALSAVWSLALGSAQRAALICSSELRETAAADYEQLVRAHRRTLGRLAGQIAGAARAYVADRGAECPR